MSHHVKDNTDNSNQPVNISLAVGISQCKEEFFEVDEGPDTSGVDGWEIMVPL